MFYAVRHVMLPKDIAKKVPKTHLMSETEWRNLGVQQSQGWVHYMIHQPGMCVCLSHPNMCFYKSITVNVTCFLINVFIILVRTTHLAFPTSSVYGPVTWEQSETEQNCKQWTYWDVTDVGCISDQIVLSFVLLLTNMLILDYSVTYILIHCSLP